LLKPDVKHHHGLSNEELLTAARAQLDDAYFLQFRRPTESDSPAQEFTLELIRYVASSSQRVLTNSDYAKIVLGAINDGVIAERMLGLLTLGIEISKSEKPAPVPPSVLVHYRPLLQMAAENPVAISPLTCAKLRLLLAGKIIGVPVPEIGPTGSATAFRVIAANFETAFDYAALLLFSDFAFQLRRCKLTSCPKLFLAERGVKDTPRKYCDDECRKKYLSQDGKVRVYAARAGVSTDKWREILNQKGRDLKPSQYFAEPKSARRGRSKK